MTKVRRSRSLSLVAIVDESMRIIRAQGVAGLTMRAVAARLGVTPMAVYYYVADKEDLLRLIADRVSGSVGLLEVDPGQNWQDALRTYLTEMWEISHRYPGLSTYMINQPALGVTPERLQAGIDFFEAAGFSPERALLAWSYAVTYIHGRISVDAHLGRRPDALHLDGLRAPDYVQFGVDAIIGGLQAMLEEESTSLAVNLPDRT